MTDHALLFFVVCHICYCFFENVPYLLFSNKVSHNYSMPICLYLSPVASGTFCFLFLFRFSVDKE